MITKQEWLIDIENTEKEMEAYKKLYEAYQTLAELPENKGTMARNHHQNSRRYAMSYDKCKEFYMKLKGIDRSKLEDK